MRSHHISVVIAASPDTVVRIAGDPERLPEWAAGLAGAVVAPADDGGWRTESPMGTVRIVFAAANPFGVLDHEVTLPDGTVTLNPMRVLAHPDGAEVLFTVRQFQMPDAEFERDSATIRNDLERLRSLIESQSESGAL